MFVIVLQTIICRNVCIIAEYYIRLHIRVCSLFRSSPYCYSLQEIKTYETGVTSNGILYQIL